MKRMKLILFFILFAVVFSCNNNQQEKKVDKESEENTEQEVSGFSQDKKTKILSLSNGKKIYVLARIWGISSNHEEIVFSETAITVPDKGKDYIFYTDEVLYKIDKNTLTLYAPQSGKSIPKTLFKDIRIIFKGLITSDEIKDYSQNYKKYGLEKMSIHE